MWPPYILAKKQKSLTCFKIEIKFSSVKNPSLPFSIGGQVGQTVKKLVGASYVWMVIHNHSLKIVVKTRMHPLQDLT